MGGGGTDNYTVEAILLVKHCKGMYTHSVYASDSAQFSKQNDYVYMREDVQARA